MLAHPTHAIEPLIFVADADYEALSKIANHSPCPGAALLRQERERATVVGLRPGDVFSWNFDGRRRVLSVNTAALFGRSIEKGSTMHSLFAQLPPVDILHDEYERLADVVCAAPLATDALALLWSELSRAAIISPAHAPDDLIRMDSVVRYTDLMTSARRTVQLVYADKEHLQPGDVPITTTLGAALIGLRSGAMFSWTEEDKPRAIRIDAVEPMAPARSGSRRRRGARAAEKPGTSSAARVTAHMRPRRCSAMQSAPGSRGWVLSFEPTIGLAPDPLLGWTTTSDPLAAHEMNLPTAKSALEFAERKGWSHRRAPESRRKPIPKPRAERTDAPTERQVDETLEQSFPASDAPSWTLGRRPTRSEGAPQR